jgi:hypothetical protein
MCCDSGSSAPPPPDYSGIAMASAEQAKQQAQTSKDQLAWSKEQWNQQWPVTQRYMESMVANSDAQTANAAHDRARYEQTYQPLEDKLVSTATGWNSPVRAEQESGAAQADVATAFDAQRKSALSTLESYGIDPSQTRFGALDLGTRVSQAAATAAAGTQSRKNTEATGLGLLGEAINIGKGYPGQVSQSYAGATSAGSSGITSGLNTANTYGNMMGTGLDWSKASTGSLGTWGNALNQSYGNQMDAAKLNQQGQSNTMQGIGSLIGGAAMLAMM